MSRVAGITKTRRLFIVEATQLEAVRVARFTSTVSIAPEIGALPIW